MRSQDHGTRPWLTVTLVIGVLLVILTTWLFRRRTEPGTSAPAASSPTVSNSIPAQASETAKPGRFGELSGKLLATAASLQAGQSAESSRHQLAELCRALSAADPEQASAAVQHILNSGVDAPGSGEFQLGAGGSLVTAPSMRVFLLDLLAEIDPQAAVAYSRRILEFQNSADEWAIALRNVARLDSAPDAREFLERKTSEMLRNDPWVKNPSTGFLEAFDVAVHLGGTHLLPPLTGLVQRKDNQAVAHAAFLALDRMVIRQPIPVLTILEQNAPAMEGREQTRGNYFARADVGDPAQRALVERYLLNPQRQTSELESFAGVFPNANFMISHNLLTGNVTLDGTTLAGRDRDALRVVNEWLADARFSSVRSHLSKIQQRLQEFARQAEGAR